MGNIIPHCNEAAERQNNILRSKGETPRIPSTVVPQPQAYRPTPTAVVCPRPTVAATVPPPKPVPLPLDFLADAHEQLRPQTRPLVKPGARITVDALRSAATPPNRVLGAYPDVTTYLRTHLQLLHDDYFVALQEGLADLRAQQLDVRHFKAGRFESNSSFWVYNNKAIEVMVEAGKTARCKLVVYLTPEEARSVFRSNNLNTHAMERDASKDKNNNGTTQAPATAAPATPVPEVNDEELESDVPFMNGSLLLFTTDVRRMDDLVLATVMRQHLTDPSAQAKKTAPSATSHSEKWRPHIEIHIVRAYSYGRTTMDSFLDRPMHLLECKHYFDPYNQIHRKLGSLTASTFPFVEQFLHVNRQPQLPDYLKNWNIKDAIYYTLSKFHALPLRPATAAWPTAAELGYNDSQLAAIRHALTHRVAMVQGPPGTGKSFVGRELVSLLLHNAPGRPRIVVVCNSNQALDQFLCALVEQTPFGNAQTVVRMGSQCGEKDRILEILERQAADEKVFGQAKWRAFEAVSQSNSEVAQFLRNATGGPVDVAQLNRLLANGTQARADLDAVQQAGKFERFKNRRVFGMTSSFAAKNDTFLRSLQAEIVIVEEAAEMLEAHVIAALTEHTQHLIQIGDHKQLRPRCTSNIMARDSHMDVSLFERLHDNRLPAVALSKQHRMFATLADLIRPSIYPVLTDAANVADFAAVRGMPDRLCFMDHGFPERSAGTSKCNPGEAQMVRATCAYLLQQGYQPDDIVVLCTYRAQLALLETGARGSKRCHGCRLAVVDGFQGREARIVLVSLVRNNAGGQVGFMAAANRACVALSRAREGLYMFGNLQHLAVKSDAWSHVLRRLAAQPYGIGVRSLVVRCERHRRDSVLKVSHDFQRMVPLGGCALPCHLVLPCGHACQTRCHGQTTEHRCPMPCRSRLPQCGHSCVIVGCRHDDDHQCMRRCKVEL